ncbi:hypothetical protein AHAS_Ahas01G0312600 [Arachis hypogaea]
MGLVFCSLSKFLLCAISGALTLCFAVAGALTGAIAGALAAKATHSGLLRGASLGAVAGAILSVEILEASRAYWCMEQTGSRGTSSMADFIEELVRARLIEESISPDILTAYNLQFEQVAHGNRGYDEIHDVNNVVASRGMTKDSLNKLPQHVILKDMKAEDTCCAICLQVMFFLSRCLNILIPFLHEFLYSHKEAFDWSRHCCRRNCKKLTTLSSYISLDMCGQMASQESLLSCLQTNCVVILCSLAV